MNLSKSAFRRYKVIDNLLRNKMRRYPNMEEIIQECITKLDFEPSPETIQKDIANMRLPYPDGFDAPIRYCPRNKGYEYTDPNYALSGISLRQEELDAIRESVDVIKAIGGSRISEQFNHAVEKLMSVTMEQKLNENEKRPILQTMIPPQSRGFEHFDCLYEACKHSTPVSFIHFSYKKRIFKHITLHPFLIKEFENRWYVIGYSEQHNSVRTFGLDRISEPMLIKKRFHFADQRAVDAFLNDVYGVFPIPDAKKERIVVRVSQLGTHYLQAYPLHTSQEIKKNSSGSSEVSFNLVPSIELARYILSQGRHMRILEPQWFAEFTKELSE